MKQGGQNTLRAISKFLCIYRKEKLWQSQKQERHYVSFFLNWNINSKTIKTMRTLSKLCSDIGFIMFSDKTPRQYRRKMINKAIKLNTKRKDK